MVNGNPGHLQLSFYDLRDEKPSCQGNIFYDSSGKNGVVELAQMVLDVNKKIIKVGQRTLVLGSRVYSDSKCSRERTRKAGDFLILYILPLQLTTCTVVLAEFEFVFQLIPLNCALFWSFGLNMQDFEISHT